jgi:hypothetical protein
MASIIRGHRMNEQFRIFVEGLHPKFEKLMTMEPVINGKLPKNMPKSGIYLFSENGKHLYIGRTRNLRSRYSQHSRPSSKHNNAPFAFKLAKKQLNIGKATYKPGEGSRLGLSANVEFALAFSQALSRIRAMEFRYVEETDPTAQCLLEVYASVALQTPHNDFETS